MVINQLLEIKHYNSRTNHTGGWIIFPLISLLQTIYERVCYSNSKLHVIYLRKKGVIVGEGTTFFSTVRIDISRPSLVEIGKNCTFTDKVSLVTHGFDWSVIREKYGEVLCSSGKVTIEDNVFIGINTIITKGVRVGRDSIIGAGSVVTHDIPAGSVAVGNPCKVIMSIDEYYQSRKKKYVDEAKAYARQLYLRTGKIPRQEDFWEEFPIFLKRDGDWGKLPVRFQLGSAFANFLKSRPLYSSFEAFLIDSGIPREKIVKQMQ
jgi:acetyltransferase-like isoleucine patch superfamily enzyme